jgi:hypothetical protein
VSRGAFPRLDIARSRHGTYRRGRGSYASARTRATRIRVRRGVKRRARGGGNQTFYQQFTHHDRRMRATRNARDEDDTYRRRVPRTVVPGAVRLIRGEHLARRSMIGFLGRSQL